MPKLAETLQRLSLSHQVRLLRLTEPAQKLNVAAQAADEGWTVKQLESRIRDLRGPTTKGRPQDNPILGNIKLLTHATKSLRNGINDVAPLPERCAKITADDIDTQRRALDRMKELIADAATELDALAEGQAQETAPN